MKRYVPRKFCLTPNVLGEDRETAGGGLVQGVGGPPSRRWNCTHIQIYKYYRDVDWLALFSALMERELLSGIEMVFFRGNRKPSRPSSES